MKVNNNLIFTFSATGNSLHVAQRVAETLHAQVNEIDKCLEQKNLTFNITSKNISIGFVFPVYFWGLPTIVRQFVELLTLEGEKPAYVYDIVTFGTSLGEVHQQLRLSLSKKGITLNGNFGVRMVDVWTPMFDVSNKERCLKRTLQAETEIKDVIAQIKERKNGRRHWSTLPHFISMFETWLYPSARRTKHFHVINDRCTGCGLCARQCPASAIQLNEQRVPEWHKAECIACLRCLHHCPHFAIQYGKNTIKHGQYLHQTYNKK